MILQAGAIGKEHADKEHADKRVMPPLLSFPREHALAARKIHYHRGAGRLRQKHAAGTTGEGATRRRYFGGDHSCRLELPEAEQAEAFSSDRADFGIDLSDALRQRRTRLVQIRAGHVIATLGDVSQLGQKLRCVDVAVIREEADEDQVLLAENLVKRLQLA